MHEHVRDAQYTTPDQSELVWVSQSHGIHTCRRVDNPSFWFAIHQAAAVKGFDPSSIHSKMPSVAPVKAPTLIDITPKIAQPVAVQAPAPQMIQGPERIVYRTDPAIQKRLDDMESYWSMEVAAEYAVLAMMPDGSVDADRKNNALNYLNTEAQARGMALEDLCRSIGQAREDRNRMIMDKRLGGGSIHG